MTFIVPGKTKKFSVVNNSMTLGNIYSTYNIMFDADIGRIKLNPPISKRYDETTDAAFVHPFAIIVASADTSHYGSSLDTYVLANGFCYSTLTALNKLTGSNEPTNCMDATSDICLYLGAQSTEQLFVSDSDGLHYINPTASFGSWTLLSSDEFKNNFILLPLVATNRLYMFTQTSVMSMDGTYTSATSGSFTLIGGLSNIRCARATANTIWFASSGNGSVSNKAKIYEWDGVQTNPINIYTLDTDIIQSITILYDIPYAIDGRGRLWGFDGQTFRIVDQIPNREDDPSIQTIIIHRNGMITDKGKMYVLVGSNGDGVNTRNTTERCLAGIWCFDPAIGFYHYSSPENMSVISFPLALARYSTPNAFVCGYVGLTTSVSVPLNRLSITDTTEGISTAAVRTGYIITQFMESKFLTDTWNTIAIKYRQMIDPNAVIEVKYRNFKNIECNTTITWISGTQFTCSTADLAGTGIYFNTPVAIGDEVMVQQGSGVGTIAHVISMTDNAGTTTITIDRNSGVTSGTAYAMFCNYTLLAGFTITSANPDKIFKNLRVSSAGTMIQVKLVLSWRGYYDEIQELQLSETVQVPIS